MSIFNAFRNFIIKIFLLRKVQDFYGGIYCTSMKKNESLLGLYTISLPKTFTVLVDDILVLKKKF
ncbi:MAG: hypothetical protein U0W94_00555 [Buchnera aphidicola (Schlechtendalia peitan)]